MDPGYLESPYDIEFNLVKKTTPGGFKRSNKPKSLKELREEHYSSLIPDNSDVNQENKNAFFNEFGSIINDSPLTFHQYTLIAQNLDIYLGHKKPQFRPSEVSEIDKNTRNEQFKKEFAADTTSPDKPLVEKEVVNPLTLEDKFDHFKSVDVTKIMLCNS
jgi:hypothetical protein